MKKSFFGNKKFRYGGASVIFTAAILALIVVINAVFSLLASHYHWYIDMTAEQLYTMSDTSKELLSEVFEPDSEGKTVFSGKVTVLFLQDKDKIEDSTFTYTGDQSLKQIHELALDYAAEFPENIELKYVDMFTHPGTLAVYKKENIALSPTSIIFDNNDGLHRAISYASFYATDSSNNNAVIGFMGEHKLTSTILSLCNKRYIAYEIEGHGEDELPEAFRSIVESCGFTLRKVNLAKSENFIEMVAEDNPRLVIINNPKYEFGGKSVEEGNEIPKLKALLDGTYTDDTNRNYASLMVFADPDKNSKNTMLNSLLTEWGLYLNTESADLIRESGTAATDAGRTTFYPEYATDDTFASNLISRLAGTDNYNVILNGSGTVKISDVSSSGTSTEGVMNGKILRASGAAENDRGNAAGGAVFGVAQRMNFADSGHTTTKYNYVLACADSSIISDEYLNSAVFANEALMVNLLRTVAYEKNSTPKTVVLEYKDYVEETNVVGVTDARKKAFLVFMAVVLPLATVAVGTVVYVRRKNK